MNRKHIVVAARIACICFMAANVARGAILFIDPSQSTITLTGDVAGIFPIIEQSPGSNVITFDGTVDIDEAPPGFLTFNGAVADALLQPLPQSPLPGGGVGTAPADAGMQIGAGAGIGTVAIRDFVISVTGVTPYTPPTFDLTALTFEITSGTIDFSVPGFSLMGSEPLAGTTAMPTAGVGTLVAGLLTLPVDVSIAFEPSPGIFATVNLVGQFVAVVPEPSSMAMLAVGLFGLVSVGWRRIAKSRRADAPGVPFQS